MTDRNKFEEMLERLVNEDKEGAEALFHEIVVEKSRDIYESLLSEEEEEVDEATDEEVDESEEDLDESSDEDLDESDEELDEDDVVDESEEEVEEGIFDEADPTDDMMGDIEMPDMGGDMDMGDEPEMDMDMGDEGEGDVEDRLDDIEDMLDELKAEFDAMMADEGGEEPGDEEPEDDMPMDMDSEEGDEEEAEEEAIAFEDEEVDEAAEEVEESKTQKSQTEIMREYTDKVTASMGDNGANAKSVVAGKNDIGGTAANIAKGATADEKGTGASAPKEDNAGNVNVPGAKGATKMASQPGHGAEKKGKPEQAAAKKSTIGS